MRRPPHTAVLTSELSSSQVAPSGGVILVVDDTADNRYVAAKWLERAGFRVALASTGEEALALARRDVDLVVLDVHLPDLHGFEVARKLKSDPATNHLPVLHLSAKHIGPHDRITGLEAGADAYLTQPIIPEELIANVRALLRLSRAERALHQRNLELEAATADAIYAKEIAERVLALSIALANATALDDVATAVVRHATSMFHAAGAVLTRHLPDSANLEILAASDMPEDVRASWRQFPLDADVPLAEVARTGEPIFLESRAAWAARYPDTEALLESTGHHANAVAALIIDGKVLGSLGLAFTAPRSFSVQERALLQSTAQHAAQALERARLLESEHASHMTALAASRAKSDFLAVMSHELRTPLNAIGGYASLMEMGLQGPVTAEQMTSLGRIQRSQRHLLGLINGVLSYSRLEGGHVEYTLSDVHLDDVLSTCESLVAPQAQAKNVSLEFRSRISDIRVRADQDKLQQVVLNLLSNAVKFTPPHGAIRVTCDVVSEGSVVAIRVTDTGVGIDPSQQERIFQPFVQLDSSLTLPREGTGLGLSISRDLARGMGGDLIVESRVGEGSTFTLVLPRAAV
jgi:signal transduction histidine kinase